MSLTVEQERDAWKMRCEQYDRAHALYDVNLIELLHRCQNGDATCAYTASIVEAEATKLRTIIENLVKAGNEALGERINRSGLSDDSEPVLSRETRIKLKAAIEAADKI